MGLLDSALPARGTPEQSCFYLPDSFSRQLVNRDVKKASSVAWSSLLEIPESNYWEALNSVYGLHHR